MTRVEKTVFLSYRHADKSAALLVFKDLTQHGYDVFIDYDGIASGDFERSIIDNINARAHFVVLLTPTALDRCTEPADWLRREIEVAIAAQRNIVPLLLDGFDFSASSISEKLVGPILTLSRYQALEVPLSFFDEAMERLRRKYLAVPINAVLHPLSPHAQQVALEQHQAAIATPTVMPDLAGSAEAALLPMPPRVRAPSAMIPPKTISLSGRWQTWTGSEFHIMQSGSTFTFVANDPRTGFSAKGRGIIEGKNFQSVFDTNIPSTGTGEGTVSNDGTQITGNFIDSRLGPYTQVLSR